VALIRGTSIIEIQGFTKDGYRLVTLAQCNTFSTLRSLKAFRPVGSSKDLLLLSSDSGSITLVEYIHEDKEFALVVSQSYGPPGCRLNVPGQYIAADPHGTAVLIGELVKTWTRG